MMTGIVMEKLSFERVYGLNSLEDLAKELIEIGAGTKVWCFSGELGSGKTTLIQAICKELYVLDKVVSPTYSLLNEYQTESGESIYHFDIYRIKNKEEVFDLGYQDYFFSGKLCLVEWPELIAELIPEDSVQIKISLDGEQRKLTAQY